MKIENADKKVYDDSSVYPSMYHPRLKNTQHGSCAERNCNYKCLSTSSMNKNVNHSNMLQFEEKQFKFAYSNSLNDVLF